MSTWLAGLIGFVLGGGISVIVMAMLAAAGHADEYERGYADGLKAGKWAGK